MAMPLHLPTLLLTLLMGFALLALELAVAQRRLRRRPELRLWALGSWAMVLAFVAMVGRPLLPLWLSMTLGHGLIMLGLVLYAHAIHRMLRDAPAPRWMARCLPVLWLCLLAMVQWPLNLRISVLSLVQVALLLPSVQLLWRHGWRAERSLRTVTVMLLMAIAALLVRAWQAASFPEDHADTMQPGWSQGLTFLVAYLSLLGAGFGFVLAVAERVVQQLEVMASHDGLTGCLNRSTIDTLLSHMLRRARRDGAPLAFVLLDIDHFKQVNDRHGHRTGDEVLRRFADTVRQRLRASDEFGRTGGEEFGLLLPGTDAAGARVLVESVRRAVEQMDLPAAQGEPLRITVSAGVAVATPGQEASADRLYGRADQSLYEAKRAGRNRVEVYGASSGQGSLLPEA